MKIDISKYSIEAQNMFISSSLSHTGSIIDILSYDYVQIYNKLKSSSNLFIKDNNDSTVKDEDIKIKLKLFGRNQLYNCKKTETRTHRYMDIATTRMTQPMD